MKWHRLHGGRYGGIVGRLSHCGRYEIRKTGYADRPYQGPLYTGFDRQAGGPITAEGRFAAVRAAVVAYAARQAGGEPTPAELLPGVTVAWVSYALPAAGENSEKTSEVGLP